jgi:serine/threonine-protein kinase
MSPATELVGSVLDGKLRIESLLASGAAGDVYKAMHLGLGTHVAVKVLRPGGGETADIRLRRFLREARVAARLRSPHVVRVFDIVAGDGDLAYIVMELLEGETLAERVQRDGPLPVRDAVEFIRQASHALGEMHDAGIVHRDVKPSNLFLEQAADGARKVKLLDFGVAALRQPVSRDSGLTFSEAFIGTPRYMAPEQIRSSKSVDARADVWALAVTLHELLAGTPPFDGLTVIAILNQIERGSPRPLERPGVPAGLVALIRRCMSSDPGGRPANARALAAELEPFGDVPAAAAPVAPTRRRVALVAATILAVTLLVLLGLRRPGDARPTVTAEPVPAAPSASTAPVVALGPDVSDTASASPPAAPPPPVVSARVDPTSHPRPRPAPARPVATMRPSREADDRIE